MEIYDNEFKAIEETVSKDFFIPNLKNENEQTNYCNNKAKNYL